MQIKFVFGTDGGIFYSDEITLASGSTTNITSGNKDYNTVKFYYGTIDGTKGANGEFSILSKNSLGIVDMEIYTISGQRVHNSTFELSNVKKGFNLSLNSGLYLIRLKGNNFEVIKRIIIK